MRTEPGEGKKACAGGEGTLEILCSYPSNFHRTMPIKEWGRLGNK